MVLDCWLPCQSRFQGSGKVMHGGVNNHQCPLRNAALNNHVTFDKARGIEF